MADLFYLQDSRSNVGSRAMFWRAGGDYTSNLDEAEAFSRERAVNRYLSRETDLPLLAEYVWSKAESGVDSQYLSRPDAEKYRNEDGRCYVAYSGKWDGNDLVWIGGTGPTANLENAIHPDVTDAEDYRSHSFELWPCGYILDRARPVVRASMLDFEQAKTLAGLELAPMKRIRLQRNLYNCNGCGRIISELQRFDDCPNCGATNAP